MGGDGRALVVIGASAGGVEALTRLVHDLPADLLDHGPKRNGHRPALVDDPPELDLLDGQGQALEA